MEESYLHLSERLMTNFDIVFLANTEFSEGMTHIPDLRSLSSAASNHYLLKINSISGKLPQ